MVEVYYKKKWATGKEKISYESREREKGELQISCNELIKN